MSNFLRLMLLLIFLAVAEASGKIGINYGQLGDDLPTPAESIQLIKNQKFGSVKIYDANPRILKALAGTNLRVSIMVPNDQIVNISNSRSMADEWITNNLLPFYPKTKIRFLLVGNEILSDYNNKNTWRALVPAMRKLKHSLRCNKIKNIKVGTTLAMDTLETSFPPSSGTFRADIAESVMKPMLQFLNRTKSFLFIDVYPYFAWAANPGDIKLGYALLRPVMKYTDPVTGYTYSNLLDQMLDAVAAAMDRLGYPHIRILIAETGWPNSCDLDQIGGNLHNAAIYIRNLVRKLINETTAATPARPRIPVRAFIFSLYNENQKPGPTTERSWGLLYPNKTRVYDVDVTGRTPNSAYGSLPRATNNKPYRGEIWCVASPAVSETANKTQLLAALNYACKQGNSTCAAIQPGKVCYGAGSLLQLASYAFNSYWAQFRKIGGTCYFNGLAAQTTRDPSRGDCRYPSVNPSKDR